MRPPPPGATRPAAVSRRSFASGLGAGVAGMVGVAATLATPFVWAQPRLEKSKILVAVGGKSSFYVLPLTFADQLDYFKAEGLDIEIVDFGSSARALQAVASGAADVACGAYENTIRLQSKNLGYQAFVLLGRAPQVAVGVSNKTLSGYKTPADLKGKKLGVSAVGASTHLVANLAVLRSGLASDDVNYVAVGAGAAALTALRTGQVDAISNVDPVMTMLEQKGEVRIITDTRTLKGTQDLFGGNMPACCLYAPQDFLKKNSNTVQAATNALVHSLKWLQTAGASDIIKTVPEAHLLGDRALYLAAFNKVRESIALDGVIPDDGTKVALKAMATFDSDIKADTIALARTFTNEYARKAKEKFKM